MLKSTLYSMALMLPDPNRWDDKIEVIKDEFFKGTIHLPRKCKKQRRKELNEEYRFYNSMIDYDKKFSLGSFNFD